MGENYKKNSVMNFTSSFCSSHLKPLIRRPFKLSRFERCIDRKISLHTAKPRLISHQITQSGRKSRAKWYDYKYLNYTRYVELTKRNKSSFSRKFPRALETLWKMVIIRSKPACTLLVGHVRINMARKHEYFIAFSRKRWFLHTFEARGRTLGKALCTRPPPSRLTFSCNWGGFIFAGKWEHGKCSCPCATCVPNLSIHGTSEL